MPVATIASSVIVTLLLVVASLSCETAAASPLTSFTDYSAEERAELSTRSGAFILARAQQPFVHRFPVVPFTSSHVQAPPRGSEGSTRRHALVEILTTAEDAYDARWSRLFDSGAVARDQLRAEPVCGAGLEHDSAVDGDVPVPPLLEIHFNFSNCDTPMTNGGGDGGGSGRGVPVVTTHPPYRSTRISLKEGIESTDTSLYYPDWPHRVSYRTNVRSNLPSGLLALLPYLPEGETWRVDLAPDVAFGGTGGPVETVPTPPNCNVRYDVRVVRVVRGHTSLARCRAAIAEVVGYDPYAHDAATRKAGTKPAAVATEKDAAETAGEAGATDQVDSQGDAEDL